MSSQSTRKLLSARELIAQTNLHNEIDPSVLVRGLKLKFPQYTDEERATVKSYQDDLRKVLSLERIALKNDRSIASIENDVIKIVKRQGKWDGFESTGSVLEPHEALFLMEINRLEVYIGKVIVSLEKAYHLFLAHDSARNDEKLTKIEYLVYSHFMRFGCNLKRFKNELPSTSVCSSATMTTSNDEVQTDASNELYVWNYLYELLGHRKSAIADKRIDRDYYNRIKQSMNNIITSVKDSNICNDDCDSNMSEVNAAAPREKRKLSPSDVDVVVSPAIKLTKFSHKNDRNDPYLGSGSTNDFMVGNAFQRFKQIFDKIDIIELKTIDFYDSNSSSNSKTPLNEKFSFDLWTTLEQRKTSGPQFRLIIKQPSKSLPRNDDIFQLYHSLAYKSAIIVVYINEEMSFQAYVYRFTT